MGFCWEQRGCDDEMLSRCPHNVPGEPCPADCFYTACGLRTHSVETDIDALLNPELDYDSAVKQVCRFCHFFLTNGPRFEQGSSHGPRRESPNRFIL